MALNPGVCLHVVKILTPEGPWEAFRQEPGEIYIVGWLIFSDPQTAASFPNI